LRFVGSQVKLFSVARLNDSNGKDYNLDANKSGETKIHNLNMPKRKTSSTISALLRLASIPVKLGSPSQENPDGGQLSVLMLEFGEQLFALSVENIEGVVDCPKITPLPFPPDDIIGATSVRGKMTLVMSLGATARSCANKQRLVLLKGESQLGLLADRIEDVLTLSVDELESSGKRFGENDLKQRWPVSSFFKNKGRRIPILDFEGLLES
jgi:chemotaxis signal transduction protein